MLPLQIVLLILVQTDTHLASGSSAFQIIRIVRMVRFLSIMRSIFSMTMGSGEADCWLLGHAL